MAIEVKAPPYRIFNIAPAIKPGAMEKSKSFLANDKIQADLGFPGQEVADWHDRAIGKMGELLGKYRSLKVYMDACVHCGACSDKCHYFIGTGDPKNMPVARQDLMRSVYRRYFTLPGKLFPKLVGARNLTREVMDEWYNYFHQCSECRRCSVFCPYGIDTAEITMAAREILAAAGYGQKYSNEIIAKVHVIGNNLGLPKPALTSSSSPSSVSIKAGFGNPRLFPITCTLAMISLEYFCP